MKDCSHYQLSGTDRPCIDCFHQEIAQLRSEMNEQKNAYDIAINRIDAMEVGRRSLNEELDRMTKHASEGWNLANERTRQWKDLERRIDEIKKAWTTALADGVSITQKSQTRLENTIWNRSDKQSGVCDRCHKEFSDNDSNWCLACRKESRDRNTQ